jgi:signal transduction histidine kinase/CheY-like chemotaxis protein
MKKSLFLLLLFFSFSSTAQVNEDSLWGIWSDESLSTEIRMEALHAIDTDEKGMFRNNAQDTAFYRAQLMYDLAQANDMKKWIGRALLNKGNYHNNKGLFNEAIEFYSQAREVGKNSANKKLIGGSTFNLGLIYLKQGEADKGIAAFSQSIENFEEVGDNFKQAAALDATAMIYQFMKSNPKMALKYLEQSLKIKEELIKTDDNPRARFALDGIKNTIKKIKESFEEIKDTIDLDTYNSVELKKESLGQKDTETSFSPTPATLVKDDLDTYNSKEPKKESLVQKNRETSSSPTTPITLVQDEIDVTYKYLVKSLKTEKEKGNKQSVAEHLTRIGIIHERKNNLDSALHYFTESLKLSEELGDKNNTGTTLGYIGKLNSYQGNFEKALNSLSQGMQIFKEIGNLSEVATLQNITATIYVSQKDYQEALVLYNQNLAYYKSSGNRLSEAGTISNIGNIYRNQDNNEKALVNFEEALKIFKEINYLQGVAGVNLEIGSINFEKGLYDLALKNKARSLTISEKIGYKDGIILAQGGIASIYAAQGRHNKALSYATMALALSKQSGNITQIMGSAEALSTSYKAMGSYQKALEMNELYYQSRDSLQSAENQKAVIQRQVASEYEKQKAIDDAQNGKLIAIETQKKEYQQNLFLAALFAIVLISLLAFFNFKRYKETKRQKAIIEEQKKKVEQSEKYKEQFLANMSHEIRTPMHAISGMVKILERNDHPPSQDVYLDVMKTSSDNLVVILNDVLDLSKIEAGKLDIESIPIYPSDVIKNVMQILKYKVEEKGLSFTSQISEDVPDVVMGDPTRLNQILLNIAGNAIKFTEKGNVNIALEKKEDRLIYSIKDTGVGMAESNLKNIFDAFAQAEGSTSRQYGGTGLGLSISQQLTQLQGGKIWVESQEGVGSTFYVELPLLLAPIDAVGYDLISGEKLNQMAGSLTGIRVLLAEDNNFNQMIAMDDLSYYIKDVKIDIVADGLEAVTKFENGHYDLILMDVQMPNMNGFDATRAIRDLESKKGVKKPISIIAMTASLLKSEINSCYNAGMDNYIPKPYKAEELIGPIYEELKQRHLT